ncbi:LytTR family DNA-binding domain-containing protein [uncultured Chitinophaga sp.]|jgi:Response regulator of the LytR/AlgR family|uniref:LytR/AlgR family response regulator transcription factor n=1 Tax=uncultured Chitinophaga sp. TaxID=339340 RepID=UPI0026121654|nr:LytTR family DNA-binding domain-containing protein [uncultured Chitinophaga sp.]
MKIKCVITDDEPVARKGMKGYVEKVDFLELVGVCEDAVALNNLLREKEVHLLFLDIEMPYINGLELLQSLPHPPKVIFTTAYEQYALKGFELEAVDYLLKPISFERFLKAVNRAYEFFKTTPQPVADYLFVKTNDKLVKVNWKDIVYIESLENYVSIYTAQTRYIAHITLKSVIESITDPGFIQTHKSFVVNAAKITGIEGNVIELGKVQVPISRSMKETVMEKIVNNRLLKR